MKSQSDQRCHEPDNQRAEGDGAAQQHDARLPANHGFPALKSPKERGRKEDHGSEPGIAIGHVACDEVLPWSSRIEEGECRPRTEGYRYHIGQTQHGGVTPDDAGLLGEAHGQAQERTTQRRDGDRPQRCGPVGGEDVKVERHRHRGGEAEERQSASWACGAAGAVHPDPDRQIRQAHEIGQPEQS